MSDARSPTPARGAELNFRSWTWQYGPLALILAITALVYAPVRSHAFVTWDDVDGLVSNPYISHGLTLRGLWWAFDPRAAANWLPLTSLSHMLDFSLFGLNAGGHHLVGLALHLVNGALLWLLLSRITGDRWRGLCVSAVFLLHPLHVESVAWVSERKDVLSTCLFLVTLLSYADFVGRPARGRYARTLALFIISALAKPMVVTTPVILVVLDVWPLRRIREPRTWSSWRRVIVEKIPFVAVSGAISLLAVVTQRRAGAVARLNIYPLSERVANALTSYGEYIGKFLWPAGLGAFYPLPPRTLPAATTLAAALVTILALSAIAVHLRTRRPSVMAGWIWYLVTLLPVIGFIQVGDQAMADRYMYIPMIGLLIMAVWAVPEWSVLRPSGRLIAPAAAVLVVIACAGATRAQLGYWRDSRSLWSRALTVAPQYNFRAHAGLGDALAADNRLDEAIVEYQAALEILPNSAEVHNNLGVVQARRGQVSTARVEYTIAVRLDPAYPEAHNNLGAMLAQQGHVSDALGEYAIALSLRPDFPQAKYNLGLAQAEQGMTNEGIDSCLDALSDDPSRADWHAGVARMLALNGRQAEAIEQLKTALAIDPAYEPARQVLEVLDPSYFRKF